MNIYITIITLVTLLFFGGCAQFNLKNVEQYRLNQKIKNLNEHDKQFIYRSIRNEVNRYNKEGDESYEAGYNRDAIIAYELVNFYEGYNTIPIKKINNIKEIAKLKSQYHYKQGYKQRKKDKKAALLEFNIVMMNDPSYKDSAKQFKALKKNKEINRFIKSLENKLNVKLLNKRNRTDLESINFSLEELLKYDYKNKTALKAKKILKKRRKVLVQIENKKNKQYNLELAKKNLDKKEYAKSIASAQKVLDIDANNIKAKTIINFAKEEFKEVLINNGKNHYDNKELDKAMESFQEALKIDPFDNTSLIYSKKIQRQLKTIKSLE